MKPISNNSELVLLIIVPCLLCSSPRAFAQSSIIDQVQRAQPSIVGVTAENTDVFQSPPAIAGIDPKTGRVVVVRKVQQPTYQRAGAGVVLDSSGIIVTNAHTVQRSNSITVTLSDHTQLPASVVKVVMNLDLAFLKVNPPSPLKPIWLADSDQIKLGEEIITVGNSELLKQTVSGGKIIGIGTNRHPDGRDKTDLIQTTINLYSGDSGGPLFDHQGRLLGLMTAKETSADHSSFAIPVNKIKKYLDEIKRTHP